MESEARQEYAIADFIAAAQAHNFHATPRKATDWVGLGLLDHPSKRGAGRGRGWHKGVWPGQQLDLWLVLHAQQQAGVRRVGTLCNLPVFLWIHDPQSGVPLRQARRALATWAKANGPRLDWSSNRAARHAAAAMLDLVQGSEERLSHRRRRAINAIATQVPAIGAGQPFDEDAVRHALVPSLGEHADNPTLQAHADGYLRMLQARVRALAALNDIPDDLFELARLDLWRRETAYRADQPRLAADPATAQLAPPRTVDDLAQNACADLLTQLGVLLLAADTLAADHRHEHEAPATAATARGHGTGTQEVPDAAPT